MRQLVKRLMGHYPGIQVTELRGSSDEAVHAYAECVCNCPSCSSCATACSNDQATVNQQYVQNAEAKDAINDAAVKG